MSTPTIGYAAMLEQFPPMEAVQLTALAETHGFSGCMAADHFQPWVPAQGQSSFVWNVLTAVGERTQGDLGPGVTCPSFRFHPAIVAQAAATLELMYPGRSWLGLGAGEALNEHIIGQYWPEAGERSLRLWEAIELITQLFTASIAGQDTKFAGKYFRLETTRLWSMPSTPPPILVATAGPINARKAGQFADGIITVGAPVAKVADLLSRCETGAKAAGKDPSHLLKVLQLHLSWADTDAAALQNALTQWPNGGMKFNKGDIRSPHDLAALAKLVRPEDFTDRMIISADPDAHLKHIQQYLDLGFDRIYLHNVGRNQKEWIEVFGQQVLPKLNR